MQFPTSERKIAEKFAYLFGPGGHISAHRKLARWREDGVIHGTAPDRWWSTPRSHTYGYDDVVKIAVLFQLDRFASDPVLIHCLAQFFDDIDHYRRYKEIFGPGYKAPHHAVVDATKQLAAAKRGRNQIYLVLGAPVGDTGISVGFVSRARLKLMEPSYFVVNLTRVIAELSSD